MNNNKTETVEGFRLRGITLVEIFVALAALAIVLASATSPLEKVSARVDVDMARENIVYALKSAHRAAVQANVPVRMFIAQDSAGNRLKAGFSRHRGDLDFNYLPNYRLPGHVTVWLSEGMSEIEFLPTGQVRPTGTITLSSGIHPDYVVRIKIGHVTPRVPGPP